MDVEPIGHVASPRQPVKVHGVTAELAEARTKLREAAPSATWDAVMAEVRRLQHDEHMAPLAAMHAVYARLAAGWVPPFVR
jgi:hypothetical protein